MSSKINKYLGKAEEVFLEVLLAIMCVVMLAQVFWRYVLNDPLVWSEEVCRILFIWITFVGAGYSAHNHIHIKMDIIQRKFPDLTQKVMQVIINLLSAACYGYVIPAGIRFVISQKEISAKTIPLSMGVVCASVPVGCLLLVVALLIDSFCIVFEHKTSDK